MILLSDIMQYVTRYIHHIAFASCHIKSRALFFSDNEKAQTNLIKKKLFVCLFQFRRSIPLSESSE